MEIGWDFSKETDQKVTEFSLTQASAPKYEPPKYEPGDFDPLAMEAEIYGNPAPAVSPTFSFITRGMQHFSERTFIAASAAYTAGCEIAKKFGAVDQIKIKGAGDLLTECDTLAEQIIMNVLRKRFPNDGIISEEFGTITTAEGQHTWIIDPLDGTAAFRFGTAPNQPSVMIACALGDELLSSVIYFPITDELFVAEKGKGAYKLHQKLELNSTNVVKDLNASQVIMNHYGDAAHETEFFKALRDGLRQPGKVGLLTIDAPHSGVACRLLERPQQLAAIIHDNNPQKPKQEIWDIAPVVLMMREGGAVVVDQNGNDYKLGLHQPIIIANSLEIVQQILAGKSA